MSRIRLTHLTFVGSETLPPASIDFGPGLTVIHGASDTGKSFLVHALDFMLGGTKLNVPEEGVSYTDCLLGLRLDDASVTLSRASSGGRISVHQGEHRRLPNGPPELLLAWKHVPGRDKSISGYLLHHLGLGGRRIRTNQFGKTQDLSFRNVIHLTLVDETQMLAEVPPPLTGPPTQRTADKSTLRLLIEDADDRAIQGPALNPTEERVGRGKIKLLDRLIFDLERELSSSEVPEEIGRRLDRVRSELEGLMGSVSAVVAERNQLLEDDRKARMRALELQDRFASATELRARLGLLSAQYESDLRRLDVVSEVGGLLGYFEPGVCVFCGAEPQHQRMDDHRAEETTRLGQAVVAESNRIRRLNEDLASALADLDAEAAGLTSDLNEVGQALDNYSMEITRTDDQLEPLQAALPLLLDAKSAIERNLSLREQIGRLEEAKPGVNVDDVGTDDFPVLAGPVLREFVDSLASVLAEWNFPDYRPVDYDSDTGELIAGGRTRASRGKGVRSVLHAAFTVGLAEHCLLRDCPHPGFVVLDSPFVSYKEPDSADSGDDADAVPRSVGDAFYSYLEDDFAGQAVIIENVGPPDQLSADTVLHHFTKRQDQGRYGFFPLASDA